MEMTACLVMVVCNNYDTRDRLLDRDVSSVVCHHRAVRVDYGCWKKSISRERMDRYFFSSI